MKNKPYICDCCGTETNKARVINSGHTLCNPDNLELLKTGSLRLDDETVLRVVEQRGDFKIVRAFHDPVEKKSFWELRAEAKLHAEMDNCSLVGWECHESY